MLSAFKILLVDDEPGVHDATRMVLRKMNFEGRSLKLLHAHSGAEAKSVYAANPDVAVAVVIAERATRAPTGVADPCGCGAVREAAGRERRGAELLPPPLGSGRPAEAREILPEIRRRTPHPCGVLVGMNPAHRGVAVEGVIVLVAPEERPGLEAFARG